jgi:hypothetical protein
MKLKTIFTDGTEVPRGWCVTPDHYLTKFKVTINGDRVIERIQSKYKVVKSEGLEITVQSMKPQVVSEILAAISQRDAQAVEQLTVVLNHRS